jgi:type VI secretion system protein ImpG
VERSLAKGVTVPRGTSMHALLGKGDVTTCEFRTSHDLALWPLQIVKASYFSFAPDLPLSSLPVAQKIMSGVRLRLKTTAGLTFAQLALDRLQLFLSGSDEVAYKLYELCLGSSAGVVIAPTTRPLPWYEFLPARAAQRIGFDDHEALLPVTLRSFQGYRLVQEYFAFPHRFLFVALDGLGAGLRRHTGDEIEIVLLFDRAEPALDRVVDAANFSLHCVPAINLFAKRRVDRIHVKENVYEYHVVPDITRPMDFEIYNISTVVGYGIGSDSERRFLPLYAAHHHETADHQAYFAIQREPRQLSASQRRNGFRSSYVGSEVFISLVDPDEAPFRSDIRELAVEASCTNRDLPLQMPLGVEDTDFTLDIAAPISRIRCIKGPSNPYSPPGHGPVGWQFVSQLSLNYLSLLDLDEEQGAAAVREILRLYVPGTNADLKTQIEGIRSVQVRPLVRRLPVAGPICFGRGLEIALEVDEIAFQGGSAFLFGCVMEQFFARHVSINSFTETVLRSMQRGDIMRWTPQCGRRPIL